MKDLKVLGYLLKVSDNEKLMMYHAMIVTLSSYKLEEGKTVSVNTFIDDCYENMNKVANRGEIH